MNYKVTIIKGTYRTYVLPEFKDCASLRPLHDTYKEKLFVFFYPDNLSVFNNSAADVVCKERIYRNGGVCTELVDWRFITYRKDYNDTPESLDEVYQKLCNEKDPTRPFNRYLTPDWVECTYYMYHDNKYNFWKAFYVGNGDSNKYLKWTIFGPIGELIDDGKLLINGDEIDIVENDFDYMLRNFKSRYRICFEYTDDINDKSEQCAQCISYVQKIYNLYKQKYPQSINYFPQSIYCNDVLYTPIEPDMILMKHIVERYNRYKL